MRGTPGLAWVVTDHRALLIAIDWFDRGIHVQYPATILHHRMQRNCQMLFQPDVRFFLINGFQSSPHRVITAYLVHLQQGRIDAIMPQGVDMGIAPTATHSGQQQRAKYIPDLWGVGATILQRSGHNIWNEQIGSLQEIDEKRQLIKRSDGFGRRPANMNQAPKTVQRHRLF